MKLARHLTSILLLVLLTGVTVAADLPTARPESVGMSTQRLGLLKSEMQALVERNQLPGVLTMVAKDGKVVAFDVAGKRDLESSAPLQKDSIFRIYSMTKPITGVAMMMLFEEGKWQLNDPVSKHIPEWANLKVAKVNPQNGSVTQVAPDHAMTMRELMSHSGGLSYGVFGSTAVDKMYTDANALNRDEPLQAMIDKLAKLPLAVQPGTDWRYGPVVDIQGYVVEKLSGQPLDVFLRTRIFEPLGMKDTGFWVDAAKKDRITNIHTYGADKKIMTAATQGNPTSKPVFLSGGGGLLSTTEDYFRFAQMFLNGGEANGKRLIKKSTVELMRTNVLEPGVNVDLYGPNSVQEGVGFGLDFAIVMDPAKAKLPEGKNSFYWGGAFGTWFWIDPTNDLLVVGMMQNSEGSRPDRGSPQVRPLSRKLVYAALVDPKK